jgi:hypothetical protein
MIGVEVLPGKIIIKGGARASSKLGVGTTTCLALGARAVSAGRHGLAAAALAVGGSRPPARSQLDGAAVPVIASGLTAPMTTPP